MKCSYLLKAHPCGVFCTSKAILCKKQSSGNFIGPSEDFVGGRFLAPLNDCLIYNYILLILRSPSNRPDLKNSLYYLLFSIITTNSTFIAKSLIWINLPDMSC
jgi:hypothetical protein